ncbi:MAG: aminoglycoside phosphotransferase family protein [Candidatus Dormibacteria bacterium]
MHAWTPEVVVDEGTARSLITSQFPELDLRQLRLLDVGFDNTVWLADDAVVFRFPRREIAIAGTRREITVLPRLAPRLALAVPRPAYIGVPTDSFPWPFFGAPHIPGRELADTHLAEGARMRIARPLGTFLAALHAPVVLAEIDPDGALPVDPMGRGDMARRVPKTIEALRDMASGGLWEAPTSVREILNTATELATPPADALTHGDLHLRHILISDGWPSGVIDWGDVGRANRCVDLVPYWSVLPPNAREAFIDAYGAVGEDTLLRARVLSLNLCAVLATYGVSAGKHDLVREAVNGLTRSAAD